MGTSLLRSVFALEQSHFEIISIMSVFLITAAMRVLSEPKKRQEKKTKTPTDKQKCSRSSISGVERIQYVYSYLIIS